VSSQSKYYNGPLIQHSAAATARLATIFNAAAQDLWEIATLDDRAQMWEEARAVASRVIAACDRPERTTKEHA
jgi:hypothetical protein